VIVLGVLFTLSCGHNKQDSERGNFDETASDCQQIPHHDTEFHFTGQGISLSEQTEAELISESLLSTEEIAFVFWREEESSRFHVRLPDAAYTLIYEDSSYYWAPESALLSNTLQHSTINDELEAGTNPNSVEIAGYLPNDERISFIPLDSTIWPNIEERIAQLFESDNSPDMAYAIAPYARGGVGSHGGLSLAQSRAPMLLRGPGVLPGHHNISIRHIDIAPTVAALLGVEPIDSEHLQGQDGHVIQSILEDCAAGAAEYAVVIVLDGLSHTELQYGLDNGQLPQLSRIADDQSAWINGGSIVGWPSFSFPGHVSIHTGAYQGTHGIISNSFWDREKESYAPQYSLSTLLADPQAAQHTQNDYLSNDNETIFEAIHRQYPNAETASINELAFRGASYCRLNDLAPESPIPPPDTLEYDLADSTAILQFNNMIEDIGIPKYLALSLYLTDAVGQNNGPHGDELRESLLATDARLKMIFDAYENEEILSKTLFIITADHGMELQDPSRTFSFNSTNDIEVDLIHISQMIYLQE
jgi:phosphonoacetate hydrolase